MTLVSAFRARNGGVLLCADREELEGYAKREIDKIYYIQQLKSCRIFIAGAGPTSIIKKANEHIHQSLTLAEKGHVNILAEHCTYIEGSLKAIHHDYAKELKKWPMGLILVIAPRTVGRTLLLYRTEGSVLSPESAYCSTGSGQTIADYLADRLYKSGMNNSVLAVLAAFIFREAERKTVGVGMGTDMVFINEQRQHWVGWDEIKALHANVPQLSSAVYPCWEQDAKILEWLEKHEFYT